MINTPRTLLRLGRGRLAHAASQAVREGRVAQEGRLRHEPNLCRTKESLYSYACRVCVHRIPCFRYVSAIDYIDLSVYSAVAEG